jgi:hypothetical protein
MILAMTQHRSTSCTVFPAFSHAFNWRALRNWLMLMDGME